MCVEPHRTLPFTALIWSHGSTIIRLLETNPRPVVSCDQYTPLATEWPASSQPSQTTRCRRPPPEILLE